MRKWLMIMVKSEQLRGRCFAETWTTFHCVREWQNSVVAASWCYELGSFKFISLIVADVVVERWGMTVNYSDQSVHAKFTVLFKNWQQWTNCDHALFAHWPEIKQRHSSLPWQFDLTYCVDVSCLVHHNLKSIRSQCYWKRDEPQCCFVMHLCSAAVLNWGCEKGLLGVKTYLCELLW